MAKAPATLFVCTNCDSQFPKWSGRCLECGQWGTLVQHSGSPAKQALTKAGPAGRTVGLHELGDEPVARYDAGMAEVNRVLGGGVVAGSLLLLGGDPGIGKSTLVLQITQALGQADRKVLYVSGEESASQVAGRLKRLANKPSAIEFLSDIAVETIIGTAEKMKPQVIVVDSVQTMVSSDLPGEAGSIQQIRAVTVKLMSLAKHAGIAIILIGHVTKEGAMAGPKALEHLVDVVLYLEGDSRSSYRLLRAVKNRYGSTNEVGVFDLHERGMEEVPDPSRVFLAERQQTPGAAATVILEGSRPFVIEIQALVNPTVFGLPRRTASGLDPNRLQVLIAVLGRRAGFKLGTQDVFVNVVGGLKIQERSSDLAVCLAIGSSLRDVSVPQSMVAIAEVGLGGELRGVPQLERRLQEAAQLGFTQAIIPDQAKVRAPGKLQLLRAKTVTEALGAGLPAKNHSR